MNAAKVPGVSSDSLVQARPPFTLASSVVFGTDAVKVPDSVDYVMEWEFLSVLRTSAVLVVPINFSFDEGSLIAVSSLRCKRDR